MKKRVFCLFIVCFIFLSGCSPFFEIETALSQDEAQKVALTCFEQHKEEMEEIIRSEKTVGETDWCQSYSLLQEGRYSFVLQQTGFTGLNTKTGILYIPNDKPYGPYIHDEENANVYSYEKGYTDKYYLERIQQNWFFFYDEYDF